MRRCFIRRYTKLVQKCLFLDDKGILTVYFAYHLYLRVELLTMHTVSHMLETVASDIQNSMACVERAVGRLGILKSGSSARILWSALRQKIIKYTETGNRHYDREEIRSDFDHLGGLVTSEMSDQVPWRLIQLWYHVQNLQAVVGASFLGNPIPPKAADTYLSITDKMGRECMSEEYLSTLDDVREKMQFAIFRSLTDAEIAFVHEKSVWQCEHFLRHFKPEAFTVGIESPWQQLKSLDSGLGVEAVEAMRAMRDSEALQKQVREEKTMSKTTSDAALEHKGDRCSDRQKNIVSECEKDQVVEPPKIVPERAAYGEATGEDVSTLSDPVTSSKHGDDADEYPSHVELADTSDFAIVKLESMNSVRKLNDMLESIHSASEAKSFHSRLSLWLVHHEKALTTLHQEKSELCSSLTETKDESIKCLLQSAVEEKDEDILWADSQLKRLKHLREQSEEKFRKWRHRYGHDLPSAVLLTHLVRILSQLKDDDSLLPVLVVSVLDYYDRDEILKLCSALHIQTEERNVRDKICSKLQKPV